MPRSLLKWEIIGTIFIIAMGTLLHFVFAWSGYYRPLALIAAVNESTWEHLKIAFWPALIWAVIEYCFWWRRPPNLLVAKTASFYLTPLLIVLLVSIYTKFTGHHILALDITIFCLAVTGGQFLSFRLLKRRPLCPLANIASLCLLVFIFSCFCSFTFYPPNLPLFIDPGNGQLGIP